MAENNKKISFCIVSFIISFIFMIFVHSLNIDSRENPPLKYEKENAIFFEKTNGSENYISMRISRANVFKVFMGRDTLPDFIKKIEEHSFFKKVIKLSERTAGEIISFCSILQRYKERILLI